MTNTHPLLDILFQAFGILLSLVVPIAIVVLWLRIKRQRARLQGQPEALEPLIGSERELREAEAALNRSELELRHELLKTHVLYDRFSTFRGYSEEYVNDLSEELHRNDIPHQVMFQQTLPMGYASVVKPQGYFELFVLREYADQAKPILDRMRGNGSAQ